MLKMPNTTAAKKALRQSIKRRSLNDAKRKRVKELMKESVKALSTNAANAKELVQKTTKALILLY